MVGMDRRTGKALAADSWDHLVQSIEDILTTPRLTRVWRRAYGGAAGILQDRPALPETLISFTIALGSAINTWEPRYRLRRVWFERASQDGVFVINVDGTWYPRGHLGDYETGVRKGVELPLPLSYLVTGGYSV